MLRVSHRGVLCLKKEMLCLALSMKRGSLSWTGASVIFCICHRGCFASFLTPLLPQLHSAPACRQPDSRNFLYTSEKRSS